MKPRPVPDTLPRVAAEPYLEISLDVCVLSMVGLFHGELEELDIELGQSASSFLVDCGNNRLGEGVPLERLTRSDLSELDISFIV